MEFTSLLLTIKNLLFAILQILDPVPIITLMVVSMRYPSPRILYEGYGYVNIPVTPGCHHVKIRTWKPRPRSTVEKMRAAFLDITPSLQDMKFGHVPSYGNEVIYFLKCNYVLFIQHSQTIVSG